MKNKEKLIITIRFMVNQIVLIAVIRTFLLCVMFFLFTILPVFAGDYGWYTEGDYTPEIRIEVTLENTLDFERKEAPVIITRCRMPFVNFGERDITVVDPELPSQSEPTAEEMKKIGGHIPLKETNGHYLKYQLDDIDKDGIWDELFFMTDLKPKENKTIYLYIGFNNRGLYEIETHAGIAAYGRHVVPWWESKIMGWKLWYPTDVDLYAKREPMLVAYEEYTKNLSGYHVPYEHGSDIMIVGTTYGAGGICLFEQSVLPDSISRQRFTPYHNQRGPWDSISFFNKPLSGTRYAYDVVVNGPLRSMIRIHTMNWRTGSGEYEYEQYYTAYKNKSYSTSTVRFLKFFPQNSSTAFGCGIRKIMEEDECQINNGIIISTAKDVTILDANVDTIDRERFKLDYEAIALVVKDSYKPQYRYTEKFMGNHTFRIPVTDDLTYEYLIAAGWSDGSVNKTADAFTSYVLKTAKEYNNPVEIIILKYEERSK